MGFLSKLLGAGQDKLVKQYRKEADRITALEPKYQAMSDEELVDLAKQMRAENTGKDQLDPETAREALALCREHIWRVYRQRPYDVQLMAALALNNSSIIDEKTGEGKGLVGRLLAMLMTVVHVLEGLA